MSTKDDAVASARRTLSTESASLDALEKSFDGPLGEQFERAVETIADIGGRVIVTGMGKSGHVAAKIAATFASTGTPSFFVHPSEANHGDLGMIARDDVIVALSKSGEAMELQGTLDYSRRFGIPLIAITAAPGSTLGRNADIVLQLPHVPEACPHNLAPTSSAVMQLAMGDALAIALLESRSFSASDFGVFHPGGKLGAQLSLVRDVMHAGDEVPLVQSGTQMTEAIIQISEKGFGCVGVVAEDHLIGIITDGDLRRHLSTSLLAESVDDIMTRDPQTIPPDMLAASALDLLNRRAITTLMVTDNGCPIGIVHMHDLLRIGVA
ncbi:MAG: KpsF/GutQ family sugar-phosphate isomerase [Ahrensia sp.]|nr:KpsF/GutQ family sugar-phosphate isomerase [Ahrensia sp.]